MGWGEDGLLQGLLPSFSSSSKSSPSRVEKTVYFGQNKTASPKPSSPREVGLEKQSSLGEDGLGEAVLFWPK